MGCPRHQSTSGTSFVALLWLSAVSLLLCSPSQVVEAAGAPPPPPSPAPGPGGCSPEETSSLLRLFHGGAFNITADLPSWRPGTDCCSWEGITCERGTGGVVALDLGERFIYADVNASSLLGLPHLSSINLSRNNLNFSSSSFPSVLAGLPNLTHLNISMEGALHLEFPRLAKLVSLQLSPSPSAYGLKLVNGDLGTLVGNLPSLRELRLDYTDVSRVSKNWCQALPSALPRLQVLSLTRCSLSGPIDSCLSQLSSLAEIYLDYNDFSPSGLPSFTSDFSSLRVLSLSRCGLTGRLPDDLFRHLPKLEILDLSFNSLTGHLPEFPPTSVQILPSSMGYLKSLRELNLGGCKLTGQIPDSIANLTRLQSLVLADNDLTGPIPPAIAGLPLLVTLDLSQNRLSGEIPTGLLSSSQSLKTVLLYNNQLTGPIPPPRLQNNSLNGLGGHLGEHPNPSSSPLEVINLRDNVLEGEIPSSIFKLPRLRYLTLSFNRFNGTLELGLLQNSTMSRLDLSYNLLSVLSKPSDADSSFPSFQRLNLASCNLSSFPDFLRGRNQSVDFLDLSNNKIRGEIPTWIWQVVDGPIMALNLSHNLLEGFEQPVPDILQYNYFKLLDLHSNLLQGPLVLPNGVGFLDYSNNSLSGEIPPSICNASRLQVLDLSSNGFTGSIPPCLGNTTISVLNLRGNKFGGILPQDFGEQCRLSTLDLSENQLQGQLPRSLAKCRQLKVLNLRQNHLVDTFPSWLGNLPLLRVLVLQSNGFHGHVRCDGKANSLQSIQILDVSSNGFIGELPSDCFDRFKEMMMQVQNKLDIIRYGSMGSLGYYQDSVKITVKGEKVEITKILNILVTLDLSNNRFEGAVPSSMWKLKNLVVLNVSRNSLGGPIPPAVKNLASLESLDLSRNMLSGAIPNELAQLTFLGVLDLSYNRLSGRIPQGGQLTTFPNSSFEGNAGLCGLPVSKGCVGDGGGDGQSPVAPPAAPTSRIDWGSKWIAFALGAGIGVSCSPIVLWRRRFFDAPRSHRRR
uniref:Receptor-like protein 12 n=1 Tax=Anthurium amnicola TaxID=1678845 RepID=A0A1D1ZF29_9ARAE